MFFDCLVSATEIKPYSPRKYHPRNETNGLQASLIVHFLPLLYESLPGKLDAAKCGFRMTKTLSDGDLNDLLIRSLVPYKIIDEIVSLYRESTASTILKQRYLYLVTPSKVGGEPPPSDVWLKLMHKQVSIDCGYAISIAPVQCLGEEKRYIDESTFRAATIALEYDLRLGSRPSTMLQLFTEKFPVFAELPFTILKNTSSFLVHNNIVRLRDTIISKIKMIELVSIPPLFGTHLRGAVTEEEFDKGTLGSKVCILVLEDGLTPLQQTAMSSIFPVSWKRVKSTRPLPLWTVTGYSTVIVFPAHTISSVNAQSVISAMECAHKRIVFLGCKYIQPTYGSGSVFRDMLLAKSDNTPMFKQRYASLSNAGALHRTSWAAYCSKQNPPPSPVSPELVEYVYQRLPCDPRAKYYITRSMYSSHAAMAIWCSGDPVHVRGGQRSLIPPTSFENTKASDNLFVVGTNKKRKTKPENSSSSSSKKALSSKQSITPANPKHKTPDVLPDDVDDDANF